MSERELMPAYSIGAVLLLLGVFPATPIFDFNDSTVSPSPLVDHSNSLTRPSVQHDDRLRCPSTRSARQ